MNVKSVEKQEHSTVELTIEVSGEEFDAAVEKVYRKQRGGITVPGFRKGKAPRKIVESIYGSTVFYEDAINDVYPDAYSQAIDREKLDVVSYPKMEIIQVGREGLTFKAKVTVRPTAVLSEYKGLVAAKGEVNLTEEDILGELKPYIDRATRIAAVERPAKSGDIAVIDYEGFDDGIPFEGGTASMYELELGSQSFIPGFEEQVESMAPGEEKEINLTFPEEYHAAELAGKPVVFKVKLHEVKERIAPELDDEFAKDVSEFDTLDELKKDLSDKLAERTEKELQQKFESDLMAELISKMEVEIPDDMVEFHADKIIDDYAMRISSQGIAFEQYLEMTGITQDVLRAQAKPSAMQQIQSQLALDAVVLAEGFSVSDEEQEAEMAKLSEQYEVDIEQLKAIVPVDDLKNDLLRQKAMKVIIEHAKAE